MWFVLWQEIFWSGLKVDWAVRNPYCQRETWELVTQHEAAGLWVRPTWERGEIFTSLYVTRRQTGTDVSNHMRGEICIFLSHPSLPPPPIEVCKQSYSSLLLKILALLPHSVYFWDACLCKLRLCFWHDNSVAMENLIFFFLMSEHFQLPRLMEEWRGFKILPPFSTESIHISSFPLWQCLGCKKLRTIEGLWDVDFHFAVWSFLRRCELGTIQESGSSQLARCQLSGDLFQIARWQSRGPNFTGSVTMPACQR